MSHRAPLDKVMSKTVLSETAFEQALERRIVSEQIEAPVQKDFNVSNEAEHRKFEEKIYTDSVHSKVRETRVFKILHLVQFLKC